MHRNVNENGQPSGGQLISADMLARKLDVSKRTLQRLQNQGSLPLPIRLGGSIRWSLDSVNAWIEQGCPPLDGSSPEKDPPR